MCYLHGHGVMPIGDALMSLWGVFLYPRISWGSFINVRRGVPVVMLAQVRVLQSTVGVPPFQRANQSDVNRLKLSRATMR